MSIDADAEDVERERGVVTESITVTSAVIEGTSDGMDTGVQVEVTDVGEAEDDTSGTRHRENEWRRADRGVTDI